MALTRYDVARTLLSTGFVLLCIGNGYFWYEVCTHGILDHSEDVFGWISTNVMLCSGFAGILTLGYLVVVAHVLAYFKARSVQTDAEPANEDGEKEGEDME